MRRKRSGLRRLTAEPKINVTQTNKKVKKINERNMTEVTDRKKTDIDKREQSKHIRDKK